MKKFKLSFPLRNLIIVIICVAILIVVDFVFQDFQKKPVPESQLTEHHSIGDNVSGWAWSDTIGWIAFNCTDYGCGSSNFGVKVDFSTGNFSGYAWSDNVGWIDFVPTSGFPAAPNYGAKYNSSNNEVNGWARVELCKTAGNCNGWDGWILLGDESNSWTNQVWINPDTKEFEGWAWGSNVIGWISFNCKGPDMCGD